MATEQQPRPSTRNKKDGPAPFANDPVRGPPLKVGRDHVDALSGPNFLSTALIDYILQHALQGMIPKEILVGSANLLSFFETMNKKNLESSDRY